MGKHDFFKLILVPAKYPTYCTIWYHWILTVEQLDTISVNLLFHAWSFWSTVSVTLRPRLAMWICILDIKGLDLFWSDIIFHNHQMIILFESFPSQDITKHVKHLLFVLVCSQTFFWNKATLWHCHYDAFWSVHSSLWGKSC